MHIKYLTSILFTSIFSILSASDVLENEKEISKAPSTTRSTVSKKRILTCRKAQQELVDTESLSPSAYDAVKKMYGRYLSKAHRQQKQYIATNNPKALKRKDLQSRRPTHKR
jgi:hypothetical protein